MQGSNVYDHTGLRPNTSHPAPYMRPEPAPTSATAMTCCHCEGIRDVFDEKRVRKELKQYHRKGLRKTSRLLVDALLADGGGQTLLDVGGGLGGIQLALLRSGVRRATSVDASPAYVAAARQEAGSRGLDAQVDYVTGDFVEVAGRIEAADVVTLDRVVCCYPDMPALVGASAARARHLYGLVYPRDAWWMYVAGSMTNLLFRLRRSPMRFFVHPAEAVEAEVQRHGFESAYRQKTLLWQVFTFRRTS